MVICLKAAVKKKHIVKVINYDKIWTVTQHKQVNPNLLQEQLVEVLKENTPWYPLHQFIRPKYLEEILNTGRRLQISGTRYQIQHLGCLVTKTMLRMRENINVGNNSQLTSLYDCSHWNQCLATSGPNERYPVTRAKLKRGYFVYRKLDVGARNVPS